MSSDSPILLVLGAGPNVGQSVAKAFHGKGYRVALTSRTHSNREASNGFLNIVSDLSDPESVTQAFARVKEELGIPSVVVYNGESACILVMSLQRLTVRSRRSFEQCSGRPFVSPPRPIRERLEREHCQCLRRGARGIDRLFSTASLGIQDIHIHR